MDIENDPHAERDRETSDSVLDAFDRRSVLRTLGTGLVAFGGTSGSVLAQTDQNSESSDRLFEVSYGTNSELVAPFNGTEPITDVYDYSGYTADIELQKEDTARLFLYDGPNGLSLGTVIDSTSSDDGGQTGYEIDGFPADGAWVIKDDSGDTYGTAPAWSWDSGGNTDGGVIRGGFDGEFEITITPELNQGRDDPDNDEDGTVDGWEFVYGEFENGSFQNVEVIDLKVNGEPQSVTITPSGQQTEAEVPEPSIDSASVRLSRTAVEAQADEQGPTLEVTVSNAEDVRAELNAETVRPEVYDEGDFEFTMNPVDSPEVPMLPEQYRSTEDSDRERYRTAFVIPDVEPGTWVPITIVAEGPGGTAELTEYSSSTAQSGEDVDSSYHASDLEYNEDNQFTDIGKRIGFGVFDNVIEGPMVIARAGEDGNTTDEEQRRRAEDIRFYERAREHDINRALVSNVMTMGAVGIDIRFDDNGARVYQLPKSEYNSGENLTDDGINKSGIDYDDGSNAFYAVATEPLPFDLPPARDKGYSGKHISSSGISKVHIKEFVPSNSNSDDYRNEALGTHLEELLHAYGYPDLYRGKDVKSNLNFGAGELDLFGYSYTAILSTGTRIADSLVIKRRPATTVGDDTESPTVENSFTDFLEPEAARIGNDTSWESQRFDIKKITNYSLGDEAILLTNEAGETDTALIPEWRENIPNEEFGNSTIDQGIVFYRYKQRFARGVKYMTIVEPGNSNPVPRIITPEDEPTTIVPGIGIGYELKITFDPAQSEDGNLLVEKGVSNGILGKLASGLSEDGSGTTESLQTDTQQPLPPTPSLRAVDADGRVTGYTDDGEYVRDIPGSQASGDQHGGLEWIKLPEDTDVEFEVVYPSANTAESQDDSEDVNPEGSQRICEVEELRYDADAELTVTDEGTTVEGVQKEMHRGTVEPDQTVQTTELSLPEEDSQSTEQPTEQEQTQEQVTEAADTESNEEFNVDIDVEDVSTLPPAQVGGALAAGVTAAYLLKRRL